LVDVFAHHQERPTVFTASGNVHQYRYRLVSWMSWNSVPAGVMNELELSSKSSMTPAGSDIGEHYQKL
jgi:hypothetical protein